ncbi:MAG: hypothetical protein PVI90_03470 [Desulfobacteraceae bacterium]
MILVFITNNGFAKDLTGRLGVGFNTQLSASETDAISVKYWYTDRLGIQGILGLLSSDDYDEYNIGSKVYYKIKDEENLHVDAFAALAFTHIDPNDEDTDTDLFLGGGFAIEYFFSGLPNLGFSSEIGLAFVDYDDNNSFGTTADTAISAGIHYYFDFMRPPVDRRTE